MTPRRPGTTDLHIEIFIPEEETEEAANRLANRILLGVALVALGLIAASIAGAWS